MLTALLAWYTALAGLCPLGSPRLPCQSSQGVDLTDWLQGFEHTGTYMYVPGVVLLLCSLNPIAKEATLPWREGPLKSYTLIEDL